MSTGDVSGSKDHDHERGTDRERGDDARRAGDDGAADGKNEKECADKFRDIFVHRPVSSAETSLDWERVSLPKG